MTYQYCCSQSGIPFGPSGNQEISWYDEGTGPYPSAKPNDKVGEHYPKVKLTWREKELFDKYQVYRKAYPANEPVEYPCFVLRIDGTDSAAISALITYAYHCDNPLSDELKKYIYSLSKKKTDEEILDEADDILSMHVEGVSDDQWEVLRSALDIARRESVGSETSPDISAFRELIDTVVPEPKNPAGPEVWEHVVWDTRRKIRADLLSRLKMMEH
jgi:hypothetical protein